MAEERLIDRDKNKKYRIRKNADGEDELYIDGEEVEEDVVTFAVDGEDEECFDEQALALSAREECERKVAELIDCARTDCEQGKYSTAVESLHEALSLDSENGEAHALRLIAYTRNFTDYSKIEVAAENADAIKRLTDKTTKAQLFEKCACDIQQNIQSLTKEVEELNAQNQNQKQVRAKKFLADRRKVTIIFACIFAALCVFVGVCVYGFVNVYAVRGSNTNLIIGIVFAALAAVALVALIFCASKLVTACRRVRLNNSDYSTKLGRELVSKRMELNAFTAIYNALKG